MDGRAGARRIERLRHRSPDPQRDPVSGQRHRGTGGAGDPGHDPGRDTGLLANFNTDTVRLQADAGIQVGQVVTRDQGRVDSPSPREAELEAKILALQDQVAVIEADYKAAQLAHAYLERLGGGENQAGRAAPLDPKALLATLDAIRKGGADALERMHNAELKKRALARQLEVLKRDLAKVQASTRESRTMTVAVLARQPGKLLLSYQVNRAGWKPTYRASLDSAASTIDLERMASISQKTGEDWSNVRLRLSTGQPKLSVYAPDPSPWLLTWRAPEQAVMQFRYAPAPPAAPAHVTVTGARNISQPAPADDYIAPVLETQGSFTTEFEVPARVNLASDGREISVALSRLALQVKQQVRIAPRDNNDAAVVTAEAARPDGVWLPGQVQLRRDGSYVGALHWDPQASERFSLAFGRDPLLRVAVENRNEKSGQAGFFNRDNQRRIADTYVVTSFHRQPIDILVLEPTPVSQSDKVVVKAAFSPEPTVKDWQQRRGLVGWEKTLKPNETARFNVDYVIDYPKEGSVQGLPASH
ncbi:MAG: mucoidy inhibitor MuiA family protein [Telluria sp.]